MLTSALFSSIHYTDNSSVIYNRNITLYTIIYNSEFSANAICTFQSTNVIFSEYSFTAFLNNAGNGAVVFSESDVIIKDHSVMEFKNNVAQYSSGGAFTCYNSNVTIEDFSNCDWICQNPT